LGQPAAKQGDRVTATDMHLIQPPGTSPPILTPHPYTGLLDGALSSNVRVMGMPAATVNSTATNLPSHIPAGGSFVRPPTNRATILMGSATVRINGKPAARNGDPANTCNDPADLPVGQVGAAGTVGIG
jgi:uncharacterized Zn-binding protein involved in type VI secretion